MKIVLILNRGAGTLRGLDADKVGEELVAIFRDKGHEVSVKVAEGKAAVTAIEAACKAKDMDAIVVGGGDGTISAAAAACARGGVALGVLPLGTMNFFAKSLGIPADMKAAAVALAEAAVVPVDIAEVNGHMFVHTLSLGIHPKLVEEREKGAYGSRYGKMLGSARAFIRVVRNPRRFTVAIVADKQKAEHRTAGIVVSNNPFGTGHMPYADKLDAGLLGLYVTTARGWVQLVRVTAAAAVGKTADSPFVEHLTAGAVEIRLGRHRSVLTTVDGELVRLNGPIKVTILPGGLNVLKPAAAAA